MVKNNISFTATDVLMVNSLVKIANLLGKSGFTMSETIADDLIKSIVVEAKRKDKKVKKLKKKIKQLKCEVGDDECEKKGGGGVVKKAAGARDIIIDDSTSPEKLEYLLGYYEPFTDAESKQRFAKIRGMVDQQDVNADFFKDFTAAGRSDANAEIAAIQKNQQRQQSKNYTNLKEYNDTIRRQLLSYSKETLSPAVTNASWNIPSFGFKTNIYEQFIKHQNDLTDSLNQFKFGTYYSAAEKDNQQFKALFTKVESETLVYLKSFLDFYYGLYTADNLKIMPDDAGLKENKFNNSNQPVDTRLQEQHKTMLSMQRTVDERKRSKLYGPEDIARQQAAADKAYKAWEENKNRQSLPFKSLPFNSLE
ncbi:MAG: hypothetical protein ACOYMA_00375 [Bacteroidia bacterium]